MDLPVKEKFGRIIEYITDALNSGNGPDTGINDRFYPEKQDSPSIAGNLNASFLISLIGERHPLYSRAVQYLDDLESRPSWKDAVLFYKDGIKHIHEEMTEKLQDDENLKHELDNLYSWICSPDKGRSSHETVEHIHRVFFPEGVSLFREQQKKIDVLRKKRHVTITEANPSPIADPAREILFTSNVLLTVPPASQGIDSINVNPRLIRALQQVIQEEQQYWYDHPVPLGTDPVHNEVLYGLEHLDDAVEFEKQRGTIDRDARVVCVLSVSVTHKGLQGIAKDYLEEELHKEKNIRHLDVYVFTEADTLSLIEDILVPSGEHYAVIKDGGLLHEVIGVDGEYGRHYSFLKAIAAFWQVFVNSSIRGTFKIDLDQVFPQKELTEQSGYSAFEHFKTPLWGAKGIDSSGSSVELGMIAGALVNQKDIDASLFTPDVCFPRDRAKGEETVFFSKLPQALSTEAEMMTKYISDELDGKEHCIQRIHVTGGTCGILIASLRKYRPFTPSFIGRAEDQAYILSVLFDSSPHFLRYLHKDGLIMRHDKEAFAKEAVRMAAAGKMIGDYIRILMFSYYVKALPWPFKDIKNAIGPFTGCFVSNIPLTVVYLRFALKMLSFFQDNADEKGFRGLEFFQMGTRRLHAAIQKLTSQPDPLQEQFHKEKNGWKIFYDILENAEGGIRKADPFAAAMQEKAKKLVDRCRIDFNRTGA